MAKNKHKEACCFYRGTKGSCDCGLLARLSLENINRPEVAVAMALYRSEMQNAKGCASHDVLVNGSHIKQATIAIEAYERFLKGQNQ